MVRLIPKWLHRGYILLRGEFGTNKFSFQMAQDLLQDDSRKINLLLAGLREYGWLTSEKDPSNKRKGLYQLKKLDDVYKELEKDVQVQVRKQ